MTNSSRRKLLKSIAAGTGAVVAGKSLPEKWTRPVVDSVMLPAHAETSSPVCVIAGLYCYAWGNNATEITVNADGTIDIVFTNNNGTWDNADTSDSVPVTGGSFIIRVTRTDLRSNFRIISGDVVCNSDTIDNATFENQAGVVTDIFPAKSNCT